MTTNNTFKKLFAIALIATLAFTMVACGGAKKPATDVVTITVGATDVPHSEVLEFIKPLLEKEGVNLNIRVFNDYTMPNETLAGGDLDANYFQHKPWLENYVTESGNDIISLIGVHIEPMGGYSKKISDINELQDGAKVGIPNAVSEVGRVLALLESKGLITLTEGVGLKGTLQDIVANPKNLNFTEVDASLLAPTIDEYDLAIINTNFALQAGFVPANDALIIEGTESPYVNVLAVRAESKENAAINKLAELLLSAEVAQFIEEKYEGAVVPAQVRY
ncbi:methionine ABC transporter substrate-binding protein [Desulfuribacillus stibiiarsenatis]|uniref:Lipoprotein n=1 Tax=Desulfuribacillus stibiiarsenatis TaxID=1390249 RepID=A0A1E5L9Y6_9FIRM|nr:MetQ/NlpA family ABC transporter substrate-binding protein [Desulfuribacillus stibiiarsenatis]OEH86941.1 methionine ABC transporter substrate-binding protein [Desulfuribacillus stibiiarsenatis]